jgi:hypothetical protein
LSEKNSGQKLGHIFDVADPRQLKMVLLINPLVIVSRVFCISDGTVCCIGERPRGDGSVPLPGREPGELPLRAGHRDQVLPGLSPGHRGEAHS